jgi:hypothetical protein
LTDASEAILSVQHWSRNDGSFDSIAEAWVRSDVPSSSTFLKVWLPSIVTAALLNRTFWPSSAVSPAAMLVDPTMVTNTVPALTSPAWSKPFVGAASRLPTRSKPTE